MTVSASLFAPPPALVIPAAAQWLSGTLIGTVAVSLCVIAVAFVGLALMSGRLAVRPGTRVALGCFILLDASAIAAGLESAANGPSAQATAAPVFASSPAPDQAVLTR